MKRFITILVSLGLLFIVENAVSQEPAVVKALAVSSQQTAPIVLIKTSLGPIKVQLDSKTPITTKNFLDYVNKGFYTDTLFHRVIPNFMIQGGGFSSGMIEKTTLFQAIENEADKGGLNKRGTIAMARTSDPNSATAQFFINVKDNSFLDFTSKTSQGWGYCVFGQVIEGMDVVDKIATVSTTNSGGFQDVPQVDVVILGASVVES